MNVFLLRSLEVKYRLLIVSCQKLSSETHIIINNCPKRCDYIEFYYIPANSSTCLGWYLHPSSGAHVNCNYSIWHSSNRIYYLSLSWRSRNSGPGVRSSDSSTIAEGSKYGSTSARCCKYSLGVLLTMGEGITRNMWSCLQKYSRTVYSRILLDNYWHWFTMHGPMNIKFILIPQLHCITLHTHVQNLHPIWSNKLPHFNNTK